MYEKLIDTGSAEKLPIPQDAWLMYKSDNHELIRLDLNPGEKIHKHPNDWRIIFYVLEGEGLLNIEDQSFVLKAHHMMAVTPGLKREWINNGDHLLKLLVVKTLDSE